MMSVPLAGELEGWEIESSESYPIYLVVDGGCQLSLTGHCCVSLALGDG